MEVVKIAEEFEEELNNYFKFYDIEVKYIDFLQYKVIINYKNQKIQFIKELLKENSFTSNINDFIKTIKDIMQLCFK